MLSAETGAWGVREGADLFNDSRSEEAELSIVTWKRTRVLGTRLRPNA